MNNLSTATSTDISGLIGALELGDHMDNHSDRALEEAGTHLAGPVPTTPLYRNCVSDGVLEEAGMSLGDTQMPTRPRPYGHCINDGALEAAGATMNPPIRTQIVLGTICR